VSHGEGTLNSAVELLARLAAGDERSLRKVLSPSPSAGATGDAPRGSLDRRIGSLVRLSALLAADACTTSLHWAVESALASGVDEDAVVGVLLATAPIAGSAWLVAAAPRLALALSIETQPAACASAQRLALLAQ
jgi:4-carboxymuconolactone decarboxylase